MDHRTLGICPATGNLVVALKLHGFWRIAMPKTNQYLAYYSVSPICFVWGSISDAYGFENQAKGVFQMYLKSFNHRYDWLQEGF